MNIRRGTNNLGELKELFYLLKFSLQQQIPFLQALGNLLLAINWMIWASQVTNMMPSLAREIK